MNKTYVVIPTVEVLDEMVLESVHDGDTFRKSLDGTSSILKFGSRYPNSMGGYIKYTHTEVQQFLTDNSEYWIEAGA